MKIAMCNCNKQSTNKGLSSALHTTETDECDDDLCKYCGHYVHWRTHRDYELSMIEYVSLETRDMNKRAAKLTLDERYVHGYRIIR